jgi:hypothetical protein
LLIGFVCNMTCLSNTLASSTTSEFCAAVWDFEHEHFLHASLGESACSLSWLPDNAHSFAVGTNMGWVKVYDTRASSQVGSSCSVLAHPAPRPRKIRGIRPDPFRPHLFATYSDFPGDVVKVWDLRKVTNPASKQAVVPPSFSIIPGSDSSSFSSQFASSLAGEAEAVVDVAWSTARPGVLAVATSARRCVSFYSTSTVSGTSHVPIYSVAVPAPVQVNGLTWQSGGLLAAVELGAQHSPGAPNSPLQADRKAVVASMSASPQGPTAQEQAYWEAFRGDEEMRAISYDSILKPMPTPVTAAVAAASNAGAGSNLAAQQARQHPRLLVATVPVLTERDEENFGEESPVVGFAEVEVLDRLPLSISTAGGLLAVTTVRGRNAALTEGNIGRVACKQFRSFASNGKDSGAGLPPAAECYRYTDTAELMRQRCLSGYSADANTNLEVLADELDSIYSAMAHMTPQEVAFTAPAVANTKAVLRTWAWMHGFETTVSDASLNVANCGILEVLVRNQLQHSASNMRQSSQWGSARHPVLGATVYSSEGRDTAKKLCGWMRMFGLSKTAAGEIAPGTISRSSSGSVAPVPGKPPSGKRPDFDEGGGAEDDLLDVLVNELFEDSFERAAAFALWHGRIDLAVSVLQRAILHMEERPSSPRQSGSPARTRTRSGDLYEDSQHNSNAPKVFWDAAYGADYLQTVSLVAMCLAGYHYPALIGDPRPNSPGKGALSPVSTGRVASAGSTWASMCRHVVTQLERSSREASAYLIAACRFLLANVGQGELAPSEFSDSSTASASNMYAPVLNDARLYLEDRAAFACTYLGYDEAVAWLEDTVEASATNGSIEAVLITGLSEAGLGVLQRYIDRYDDVQTVALLVSRVIDAQHAQGLVEGASEKGKTPPAPTREWVWLHEYRNLLNRSEMFIERAYLDVELGKRYRRKAAMMSAQAGSAGKEKSAGGLSGASKRNSAPKGMVPGSQPHGKSKASRVLYRLPAHSDYPHFFLRCGFCGASLPVDGMQNVRPEHLRTQNNVLHCCAACSKQLPRCYVCQLYMVRSMQPPLSFCHL